MIGFDWYEATIRRPVDDVIEGLSELAPGLRLSHGRGQRGYAHAAMLGNDEHGEVANIWHGGSQEYPHAWVTGEWAQAGAELIRASFAGEHAVTRMDVREDFAAVGAYDAMQDELLRVCDRHRVKVGCAGDHLLRKDEGRTVYGGSPKSPIRVRLYDKRAEILSGLPTHPGQRAVAFQRLVERGLELPDQLARLETQIRPQGKPARALAATIAPVEALGCAPWVRELWRGVAGLELAPVQLGKGWQGRNDERALRTMLGQYHRVLRTMREDLGSWACVGEQLGHELKELDRRT